MSAAIDSMDVPSLPETRLEAAAVESSLRKMGVESETFLGTRADIHSLEMTESPPSSACGNTWNIDSSALASS